MIQAIPILLLLFLFMAPLPCACADIPFGIDLKELERPRSAVPDKRERDKTRKKRRSGKKTHNAGQAAPATSKSGGYLRYTVKPGDHVFKILVGRLGMSDESAEQLIPEIIRTNKISDIKNLTVGQTLLIPHQELRPTAGEEAAVKTTAALLAATKPRKPSERSTETKPSAPPTPPSRLPAAAPPAVTLICPVPEQDSAATVDSLLALLQIAPGRNKSVEAGRETGAAVSITADRYFEYKGGRYIVSIGESDPTEYTLLRVLETAGYKVLRLTGGEDYRGAAVKLLTAVGLAPEFRRHHLQEGKGIMGFLVKPEGAGERLVLLSAERPDPGGRWQLAPECGAR